MKTIGCVQTAAGTFPVLCGGDVAQMLSRVWSPEWRQAAIIGDDTTLRLFGEALANVARKRCDHVVTLSFPPGEAHKTRATKATLEDQLLAAGLDRTSCVIAVGGGIALDVAGFVAATYLRGVPHVNVATSLLAQVDAAIGGKTGVNTTTGKNLIGAFHQPRAVLIDIAALSSLPEEELRYGLAEAVKHAVLGDAQLFTELERWASERSGMIPPEPLIARCVQIKAEVVTRDEREQAYRQVLNFGHTVAHALETASDHTILHGPAVAMGMVVEGVLAQQLCGFPAADAERVAALLQRLGLPTKPALSFAQVRELFGHDKKTRAGRVHCALPERIGAMHEAGGRWALPVTLDQIGRAWGAAAQTNEETVCSV